MSTIITPSEDQINIVITDDSVNVNVTSEPVVVNVTEEIIQVSPISGAYPLPTTVYSVFGRTGSVVAQEGDYDLSKLSDVTLLNLANNDVLSYNGTTWVNEQMDLSGYVPYTGATANVDLGNNSLIVDQIQINKLVFISPIALVGISNSGTVARITSNEALSLLGISPSSYVPYTGATADVDLGNNKLTSNNILINNGLSGNGNLTFQQSTSWLLPQNGFSSIDALNSDFVFGVGVSTSPYYYKYFKLDTSVLANNTLRTYTLPNASGTLALTSSLTSYVPYTGATSAVDLGPNNIGANSFIANGSGLNSGTLALKQNGLIPASTGYTTLSSSSSGKLNIYFGDAFLYAVELRNNLLTDSRSYDFPNASGTIALTSDLSGYVALAGTQTITGSKTFDAPSYFNKFAVFGSGYSLYNGTNLGTLAGPNYTGINAAKIGSITDLQIKHYSSYISTLRFSNDVNSYTYIFPNASGTLALTSNLASYVPYTGATANVNLGVYSLTANALIKNGGVDTQFLKADGSVDNNVYLTANDLPSTLSLYATTAASAVSGYTKLVTTIDDPDYNTTAVDVSTGTITTANQFIAALVSPANLINGNPGIFNVSTYGNIKKVSGSGEAEFYFEIYKRTSAGVETLVGTSSNTLPVVNSGYSEFFATAIWNDGVFDVTDTIVLKYYATRIAGGSDPVYNFQFGGTSPVRTLVPIPIAVIPNIYMADIADVENVAPLNNEILYYNSTSTLWEHSTIAGLLGYTPANDASVVHIAGTETITGNKSFTSGIKAESGLFLKEATSSGRLTGFVGISATATGATQQIQLLYPITGSSILKFDTSSTYAYTFPSATGTLALLEANQTFTDINTFANNTIFDLEAQFSIGHYLVKGGTPSAFAAGQVNIYSETSTNNVVFRDPSSKAKLVFNNSTQTYTFPAASGTLALTSNLASYVPYTGATANVDLGVYNLTAASLIKSGGTSAQILAADGSVITAGTNITISGGTISSTGGGGGGGADIGIVYMGSLKALNFLSIY